MTASDKPAPEIHSSGNNSDGSAESAPVARPEAASTKDDVGDHDDNLTVIGVGASAGGLDAMKQLFGAAHPGIDAAFVVVTHQQSGNVSMLPELLAKYTGLPTKTVTDGLRIQGGVIHVTPAGQTTISGGRFQLKELAGARPHHPVDTLFQCLAAEYRERAIGIILSGTGSDGTAGASAIKAAGGLTLAQSADSARYPDMPANAASAHAVDCVLPPEDMLHWLEDHAFTRAKEQPRQQREDASAALFRVLHLLRARTGQDFTAYKKSTLWRRIQRRMHVRNVTNPRDYARVLEENGEEIEILFRELLISVTSFFRDPETFAVLSAELRKVLEPWDDERPFRAWVPACATGEEAYSLAIGIREIVGELGKRMPVQIFATDLDEPAIDVARAGRYPSSIEAHVTREHLERFFVKTDTGYRISKEIRESIVFAPQNVIKDPPFTKLDLISCRNLLIYLEPELQRRVIGLFSYALRPGGLLLLGSSESIATFDDAFYSVDKKSKLFRRRDTRADAPSEFVDLPSGATPLRAERHRSEQQRPSGMGAIAERVVLAALAPPSVLINERGDIAYFHGRTGKFLEPAAGEPISNLFGMVREGLRLDLSSALRQAVSRAEPVVRPGLKVRNNGGFIRVRLTVRRLDEPEQVRGMFLVSFEQEPEPDLNDGAASAGNDTQQHTRIGELELELQHTRDNLRATIEELETSNEELKSTNEELQSTNEELQSANEELETSREEMQSLNEELQTVNSELEERNRALSQANDDMQNLLNSTDVATVFLDDKLSIKRFTTQARKVFSLIDTDIGRPISDLSANLRYDELVNDAREVLRSLVFQEREIVTKEGAWRLMRIMPYRTADNVIDGLVMTFIDIDRIKREQEAAEGARIFAEGIVEALPLGVAVLDLELKVIAANQSFFETFKTNAKRAVGEPVQTIGDGVLERAELSEQLHAISANGAPFSNLLITTNAPRLGNRTLVLGARRMSSQKDNSTMILLTVESRSD